MSCLTINLNVLTNLRHIRPPVGRMQTWIRQAQLVGDVVNNVPFHSSPQVIRYCIKSYTLSGIVSK